MLSHRPILVQSLTVLLLVSVPHVTSHAAPPTAPGTDLISPDGSLSGWTAFHGGEGTLDEVWSVNDDGVLTCKGSPLGYLATREKFRDFELTLEYRWPAGKSPGKGGVLIRKTGGDKIWPKSLEAQINAGGAGDFWGLDGFTLKGPAERSRSLEHPEFGKLINLRATEDVERPAGQWNEYRIVARGETVTLQLNGRLVNTATGCDSAAGPILLTAEGSPIQFRKLRVRKLQTKERPR